VRNTIRQRIRVEGIVQGVGFRPFVYSLASRLGLGGMVGNDTTGAFIEVEGDRVAVERFLDALGREAPPLAVIERLTVEAIQPLGDPGFSIVESDRSGARRALISPDMATCDGCLRELFDPTDRRFRYPFLNCTNCGPRFTIIRDVPYDRLATTMAGFPMCSDCAREYHDPRDRRFHAQPVCCPTCGPRLSLTAAGGATDSGDLVERTASLILEGAVVAIKGLGGYHLAADASNEDACGALRRRKHREDKPFAVMVADLAGARRLCEVDDQEALALAGTRRPIVLLRRLRDAPVAPSVAPGNRHLGVMLPYTPLHHLVAGELGRPFVLTSGNESDEPIAFLDAEAAERLAPIADAFLTHDRPIHMRTDDSVIRVWHGRELPVRRSRGYVPEPIALSRPVARPVLALGAELKSAFCIARGSHAFVSHHIGDLENYETLRSFAEGIEHFRRLLDVDPEVVAHDLHPEYLSTKHALEMDGVDLRGVQHHHAHVASCLADNGEEGPVIGVAFDGLGFGTDGTIWGGEFLVADLGGFERRGHLEAVPLPGAASAIREPWRMAAAYLDAAFAQAPPEGLDVVRRNADRWEDVTAVARAGVNSPATSSAGRLFDAVAAILGVRDSVNYEGQAAIELEQLADPGEDGAYRAGISGQDPFRVSGAELVRRVCEDLLAGVEPPVIAARFHGGVARLVVDSAIRLRESTGLQTVALSGGVFQNLLLLDRIVPGLEAGGFRVLTHSRVPPNDGGISLGQAVVAGSIDRDVPAPGPARERLARNPVEPASEAERTKEE